MKLLKEYFSQSKKISLISEYLLSKQKTNALPAAYADFELLYNDIYNKQIPEDIADFAQKYFKEHKFDNYRVYWTKNPNMTATKYEKWKDIAFMNILKTDIKYDLIVDIIYSVCKNSKDFEEESIYYHDSVIVVTDLDETYNFVIENMDEGVNLNPSFKEFKKGVDSLIEFSSKPLMSYIGEIEGEDLNEYDQLCDDAKEACQEKFNIELERLGNKGKHVCSLPTYNAFHKYDEIIEYINNEQDNIVKTMKKRMGKL